MLPHSRSLLAVLVYSLLLAGCQSSTTDPVTSGYEYFPLETGRYVIYDVQKQQYSQTTTPILQTYQLKEVIGAAYTDATGQPTYRLMRYRRSTDNQPWQADSVWSARLVNNEAIRTENGLDFVTLMFPVSDHISWNGNRRNAGEPDNYEARNVGQPYRVQDKQFDQTVTVMAQNDSTLVSQDKRLNVYARQVGLIYKERTQLQFCTATPTCTGTHQIEYGIRYIYRIRTYGNE